MAEYQFDSDISECLFSYFPFYFISYSNATHRIRYIYISYNKNKGSYELYLVLRAQDNLFSLTLVSGNVIKRCSNPPRFRVVVLNEVADFIRKGRNVFARHVINVDKELRAGDEVIVTDENDNLLAVGKMKLSGEEILTYKKGVAVEVKKGAYNER
ncbi:MAG: pseudouridine synthase [Sulfolobus sp.]|nr:pseudouridine synthase [Sulfolobus sp.]